MLLYYLWREGLLGRLSSEKVAFFFGRAVDTMALSRRWPLVTAINWPKALLFDPSYARAVSRWLRYRSDLYDGLQG